MRNGIRSLKILVVDDDPLIRLILFRFLKKKFDVKAVASAEEALDEMETQHYDLCFLDVILPGMTGLSAMKIIREQSPETKVAIMTGSCLDEASLKECKDNAYAFIEKPFSISKITAVTEKASSALVEKEAL